MFERSFCSNRYLVCYRYWDDLEAQDVAVFVAVEVASETSRHRSVDALPGAAPK